MTLMLVIISVASILAVVLLAGLLARASLRPVRVLSNAVQHVVETKDFQPVTVHNATGEVARLATWFNRLLRMIARMRERQTRLVLDASHELRNPLTSLRSNVDLLAVDLRNDRLSTDQRSEIVGDVQAQLGELTGLVTDLTHLARDEDEVKPSPLDLREVVESAVDRVRRRGQDRVFDVELQPLFLWGHPDSLSRAVVNLLDNAVKWTPRNGTIRVRLEGNRLQVSDDGPGIPEADLPYVFDRFFRGKTGRGTPGTGLGLSIVAKAVEDHGGSITAGRSAAGGAEFTLQLPGVTSREALPSMLHGSGTELEAAQAVEAAAMEAAVTAKRAVVAAADTAKAAASTAQEARAAATSKSASVMAETVRQQALAIQHHASAAAREVDASATRAASRVASAVLAGHEAEARREAVHVAQITTEAAAATAEETAAVAVTAARAAASAAVDAATEAADTALLIEREVQSTAKAVQDTADATAAQRAAETQTAAELLKG